MLTYKRKLILNKSQQSKIDNWIGVCRLVYNLALEIRITAYKTNQSFVSKFDLINQLPLLRKEFDWIKEVPSNTLADVCYRLDSSYKKFFNGSGFPKWASKEKYTSLSFRQNISIRNNKIKIPNIGWLKMFKDSNIVGNIKIVTIKKEVTGYYITIITDAIKDIQNDDESQVIGLDMGIAKFCTDSNGGFIDNPKHFKKYERQLRIENRSLSRKKLRGKSWYKQVKKLALLHNKIGNVRKDFLHKESTKIAKENHTVYLENLNVQGMSKNKNLSKHILDCGWATFRTMLEYKTNVIAINPKHTSQTCNSCGELDAKSRISQSEFVCTSCGVTSNADVNASKNIMSKGIAHVRKREELSCALGSNPVIGNVGIAFEINYGS